MLKTLQFIANHPLTRDRPLAGFGRFASWQIKSRLKREIEFNWIEDARLMVQRGMTGATGNIYCGLHEFADMAFLLHLLRPGDLFVDVGANIGSYTILASAVTGAHSIAVEPDPNTMMTLKRNVHLNRLEDRVDLLEMAIGAEAGTAHFTIGLDTVNHFATPQDSNTRTVDVRSLDEIVPEEANPIFIKLDVEGFEVEVIAGARKTLERTSLLAVATEGREEAVVGPLRQAGFSECHYDPWERRFTGEHKFRHSNALYVRDRVTCLDRVARAPSRQIFGHKV